MPKQVGSPSDSAPIVDVLQESNAPGIRVRNEGSGNAIEVVGPGGVLWGVDAKGNTLSGSHPVIPGNRVWGLGDSLTTGRGTGSQNADGQPLFGTKQYIAWASMISNGRIYVENWAATSGFTTAQILATHVSTVVAAAPRGCLVLAGTNDVTTSVPVATSIANLTAIYSALMAAGITPIAITIPPCTTFTSQVQNLNAWIKRNAFRNGFPLVDIYSVLADQATAGYLTGLDDGDNIHMSPAGAQVAGQAVSDQLSNWMPPFSPWIACSNLDVSCAPGPLFLVDTNLDGVPDNWLLDNFASATKSIASDVAVLGNAWTITRGGADVTARPAAALTAAAGDRIALGLRINTSGLTASGTGVLDIGLMDGARTVNIARAASSWTRDLGGWRTVYLEGVVPSGKTNAVCVINGRIANFTIKIAQVTLMNLTTAGIA